MSNFSICALNLPSRSRFKKYSSLDSGILLLEIYSNEIIFITCDGINFLNIGGFLDLFLCKKTSFSAQSLPQPLNYLSFANIFPQAFRLPKFFFICKLCGFYSLPVYCSPSTFLLTSNSWLLLLCSDFYNISSSLAMRDPSQGLGQGLS